MPQPCSREKRLHGLYSISCSRWNRGGLLQQGPTRHLRPYYFAQADFGTAPLAIADKQHIADVQVADDPLRDLTQRSLNAHEVLPRRDVHLASAEAATFAVQMPCQNQCDRESAERCGAPHGERHPVARSGDGGALGPLRPGCSRRRTSAKSTAIEICGRWPRSGAVNL